MGSDGPLWYRKPASEAEWRALHASLMRSLGRRTFYRLEFVRLNAPDVIRHDLARRTWRVYWRAKRIERRISEFGVLDAVPTQADAHVVDPAAGGAS